MTARNLYESLLIELNKVEAPSLLLEDYNYFLNKAIQEYINRRYMLYDTTQQTTDDLQVLTDTLVVNGPITNDIINLPLTYYHLLNCVVEFEVEKPFKIYPKGSIITQGARRLTSEKVSVIQNNAFLKPEYRRPYYFIKNEASTISPKLEIRAGNYQTALKIKKVSIDYLKTPKVINLTEDQRDDLTDTSQLLEFPDYVANEIIKQLVALVLENSGDERLKTNPEVNDSIPKSLEQAQESQTYDPKYRESRRQTLQQR